jgi:hypothetical protein
MSAKLARGPTLFIFIKIDTRKLTGEEQDRVTGKIGKFFSPEYYRPVAFGRKSVTSFLFLNK